MPTSENEHAPPRLPETCSPVRLSRLWEALPPANRIGAIRALGRIVEKQLRAAPPQKGVPDEDL